MNFTGGSELDFQKSYNLKECRFDLAASWEKIAKSILVKAWKGVWPEIEQLALVPEEASAKETNQSVEEVIAEALRFHPLCQLKVEEVTNNSLMLFC